MHICAEAAPVHPSTSHFILPSLVNNTLIHKLLSNMEWEG